MVDGRMSARLRKNEGAIGRVEILSFEDDAVLNVRCASAAGLGRQRKFVLQASHIYLGVFRDAPSDKAAMMVTRFPV